MADSSGDFYRSGGGACDAAGPGWIVQTAGRSGIRLEELAHLYSYRKLRADFDNPDAYPMAC